MSYRFICHIQDWLDKKVWQEIPDINLFKQLQADLEEIKLNFQVRPNEAIADYHALSKLAC